MYLPKNTYHSSHTSGDHLLNPMGAAGSCGSSAGTPRKAVGPRTSREEGAPSLGSQPGPGEQWSHLLWSGPRSGRPSGIRWMVSADELAARPLQKQSLLSPAAQALLRARLERREDGGWAPPPPAPSRRFPVFLSSTFTDTQNERNALHEDVFPFLTTLCQRLGLEFEVADMVSGAN